MTKRFIYLQKILDSKEKLFWFLHTVGWLAFATANFLGALALERPVSYNTVILTNTVSGFIIALPLRYWNRYLYLKPPVLQVFGAVAASYLLALPWTWLRNEYLWHMYKSWYEPQSLSDYFSGVTGSSYVLLVWSGLYFGIKYYQSLQEQIKRALKSAAAAHEAQLKMLRYQLNPHFLFNTLNSISTLVLDRQNDEANQSVTKLSEFLRYTLDNDPMKKVTLDQELRALNLYLSIEKVRFNERLRLHFDVDEVAGRTLVPSLILQPLIENAIKYAVANRIEGGGIDISAKLEGGTVVIKVADDGPGMELKHPRVVEGRGGVGLRNTRERLSQIYGDNHYFGLRNRDTGGLEITICVPFDNQSEGAA